MIHLVCRQITDVIAIITPAAYSLAPSHSTFKHVTRYNFEKGYINFDFEQKENAIYLNVENSKSTLSKKKKDSGGVGLKNIKQRLEILYFDKYKLSVEETETTYQTKLIINI